MCTEYVLMQTFFIKETIIITIIIIISALFCNYKIPATLYTLET